MSLEQQSPCRREGNLSPSFLGGSLKFPSQTEQTPKCPAHPTDGQEGEQEQQRAIWAVPQPTPNPPSAQIPELPSLGCPRGVPNVPHCQNPAPSTQPGGNPCLGSLDIIPSKIWEQEGLGHLFSEAARRGRQ